MNEDFAYEPIRGLPGYLPEGERVLWQGAPGWRQLALTTLWVKPILIWFGLLVAVRVGLQLADGASLTALIGTIAWAGLCAAASTGLFIWYARGVEKTTVYTITNKRIVFRVGVAIDKTINLPFSKIVAAGQHANKDGTGDIGLTLSDDSKIGFLILWPHVRSAGGGRVEAVLKALPDVSTVSALLGEAWMADAAARGVEASLGTGDALEAQTGFEANAQNGAGAALAGAA
jgi:Bacterial PH domain